MEVGIIGANGKAGHYILEEAIQRGHDVTAIVRNQEKFTKANVSVIEKDIFQITSKDIAPFDVVVNAFGAAIGEEQAHVDAGHALIKAATGTDTRIIVVGGAGSLYVDDAKSLQLIDTPEFPEIFKPTAKGQARNLMELQQTKDITWTFVSPSAFFDFEGAKTGTYTIGGDHLLVNSQGESYISYADFALAIVDEIEQATHINQRFTVVGEK
ncbi:NAD(P)-dependent oxidoreductase [Solibacillus sp. MA9]|uniref:NAD(P)-dependent oxidoreductase n=1 Tax=Solibacillus palustris TaxID=2908203 RepID=A0ABS9UFN2_9BACL|nr:NAD(P)-dependent oxidoreductase [Solibacillus sp. MA9]MCH7322748.1 NAD(P)-dependent oxidoreductase [Solibacillus sp. MA9]